MTDAQFKEVWDGLGATPPVPGWTWEQCECWAILRAVIKTGKRSEAARLLQISTRKVESRLKQWGLARATIADAHVGWLREGVLPGSAS